MCISLCSTFSSNVFFALSSFWTLFKIRSRKCFTAIWCCWSPKYTRAPSTHRNCHICLIVRDVSFVLVCPFLGIIAAHFILSSQLTHGDNVALKRLSTSRDRCSLCVCFFPLSVILSSFIVKRLLCRS